MDTNQNYKPVAEKIMHIAVKHQNDGAVSPHLENDER